MLAEERFERILSIIEKEGSATVQQLMNEVGTSESTIRRDLNAMDSDGLLRKVHGGAVSNRQLVRTKEEDVTDRKTRNAGEKRCIGRYAAGLIAEDDFVYLDAGTTTEMMLDYVQETRAVFVTNAVGHAMKLVKKGFRVYLLGGEFKSTTEAVVGGEAVENLGKYNFTKGFWGTNGITVANGFTTPELREALVKRKSMKNCKECYVLADPSKFSRIFSIKFAEFNQATILTTNLQEDKYRKYQNVLEVNENDLHGNI